MGCSGQVCDTAAALLASYNDYRGAASFYIAAKDYAHAQAMVDSMSDTTAEESLFKWELQKGVDLYSAGKNWFAVDSATADSMRRIRQYNSAAGYQAGSITALLGQAPVTYPVPDIDSVTMDSVIADTAFATIDTSIGFAKQGHNALVNANTPAKATFSIYPNPNYGNFTVRASGAGTFTVYTMLGQQLTAYTISGGKTELQLPAGIATGIYMGVYKPDDGGRSTVTRLLKE